MSNPYADQMNQETSDMVQAAQETEQINQSNQSNNPTQPDQALVASWMESLGFKRVRTSGFWRLDETDVNSILVSPEEATFFYQAHVAAVAEGRVNELGRLNSLVMATQFHVPSRYKIYEYISKRKDELTQPKQGGMK